MRAHRLTLSWWQIRLGGTNSWQRGREHRRGREGRMSERVLTEVLSKLIDAGTGLEAEYLAVLDAHRQREIESLLAVIRLVRATLIPVQPRPRFVTALRASLLTIPLESLPAATSTPVRRIVIGAVAVGSLVSAAAVLVLVARARSPRAA